MASLFPQRPHSPGHRPPNVTSSTIQGSLPCSRKVITSGLQMARSGCEKKYAIRLCCGPQKSDPGPAHRRGVSCVKDQGKTWLPPNSWERCSFSQWTCPLATQGYPKIDREGTDMPKCNLRTIRAGHLTQRDQVAVGLQHDVPVQVPLSRCQPIPLFLGEDYSHVPEQV